MVTDEDASISIHDRGFTLGDGVFETLFFDGREIECAKPHYDRLVAGCRLFQLPYDMGFREFKQTLENLVNLNESNNSSAALRVTVTRGVSGRGLALPPEQDPTVLMTVTPYTREIKKVRLGLSRYVHEKPQVFWPVKHLGYQLSVLGRIEAQSRDVDDVVFANGAGNIVSATAANVFILHRSGTLVTPPITDGALPGVMRGKIIQAMQKKGTPVLVDHISIEHFFQAEAVFLSNSLIGMVGAEVESGV